MVFAVFVRTIGISTNELWYDELQSVTHAYLAPGDLISSVVQFDPHPPLYYFQLHYWMSLGISDVWIKLNSVIWSVLSIISIYIIGRDLFSERVGVVAAIFLLISPFSIAYAQEARMYSLVMFLGLWVFFLTHKFIHGNRSLAIRIGLVASTLAFLYCHGAAFLILFSTLSDAILTILKSGDGVKNGRKKFFQWLILQLIVLLLYLPWLQYGLTKSAGHAQRPDVENIVTTISFLILGFGSLPSWLRWVSVLATTFALSFSLKYRESRSLVFSFIIIPILVCAATSLFIRPIWLQRTLAFVTPFIFLSLSFMIWKNTQRKRRQRHEIILRLGITFVVCAALMFSWIDQQLTFSYPWKIKEAAEYIKARAKPHERIYIPYDRMFWGFSWYYVGPGSVNPITSDYFIQTAEDVVLYSQKAEHSGEVEDSCYWLVYRQIEGGTQYKLGIEDMAKAGFVLRDDDVAPFTKGDALKEFNHLMVDYICASRN
jgi:uncharacterized membrane protein